MRASCFKWRSTRELCPERGIWECCRDLAGCSECTNGRFGYPWKWFCSDVCDWLFCRSQFDHSHSASSAITLQRIKYKPQNRCPTRQLLEVNVSKLFTSLVGENTVLPACWLYLRTVLYEATMRRLYFGGIFRSFQTSSMYRTIIYLAFLVFFFILTNANCPNITKDVRMHVYYTAHFI